ncbi:glutamine--fructose-6-phosphate transaminase (isomerizing) [Paraburkholderia diazotrophica]|uniref:Glutamine--fructose-6-phosphate aminotransferase [isomerizing] n=1 Tax=Paraburkholderia diazotrophica TaxID=667676 RepID=A0A1H7E281_9BURK|nr:glutamine--fructose-6-phosphate transaminase (isomerizing) [Paraburkholderia diazotrophica]SEK05650.1 glucosamine--fructose-6-phosphate aminotransferase (isomerizing) [Paraburkholderia diazotrophica]
MCGIVAGVALQRSIVPALLDGLKRLEYRGYDSCGVAVLQAGGPRCIRTLARVEALESDVRAANLDGSTGIAHTRWATHGVPAIANAHPIFSHDQIAVVHNGIIENHEALRESLVEQGYEFVSQTDTEVIAHLVHSHYEGDLLAAVFDAARMLQGAYAIAVICKDEPQRVIGARQGSPLVVGLGPDGAFLASDTFALSTYASGIIYLEDGDVADLRSGNLRILNSAGETVVRGVNQITEQGGDSELGAYRHYMQKEIFEQPLAVARTFSMVRSLDATLFGTVDPNAFSGVDNVLMLGCGTSHYSALTARGWFETIAGIRAHAEIASEYRYRDYVPQRGTLVVPISQSGETADTLAALRYAQSVGEALTLAICNVATSAIVRQSNWAFITQAGPEIGVASTKAFTTQLVALFLLALTLGRQRARLSAGQVAKHLRDLAALPDAIRSVLAREPQIIGWAQELRRKEHALFLGRGLHYPIALEAALKMKEISYLHAEGYPAGELKHGPLALVTEAMPVIVSAPNDCLLDKLKANLQEISARGGKLYVLADANTRLQAAEGMRIIRLPDYYGFLSPLLHVVAYQLLAYHVACLRGTDVDKPRNLAKSVTVE